MTGQDGAQQPAGSEAPPPAPQRLIDRWGRWLAIGANLGVVLGLIILIVEVRQNAALTRAAMEQQKNQFLAEIELSISRREMAEVWVKSIYTPEDLTGAEARMIEGHLAATLLQWDQMFQMEDAGLTSRQRIQQHIRNTSRFYFGSRFAKNWWCVEKPGWEGTPMAEVAGPIIDALDENFLADQMNRTRLAPLAEPAPPTQPAQPEPAP